MSKVRPSQARVWSKCTANPRLSALFKSDDEDRTAADEGEACHDIAHALLTNPEICWEGWVSKKGVPYSDALHAAARKYVDDVTAVWAADPHAVFGSEVEITAERIHPSCRGFADAYHWSSRDNTLTIWDLKYGRVEVPAKNDPQLLIYLCGLVQRHNIPGTAQASLRIVQPRLFNRGPVDQWEVESVDSLADKIDALSQRAHQVMGDSALAETGAHCRYCRARYGCTAAMVAGEQLFEAAMAPAPMVLDPDMLGYRLAVVERARKQLDYLETGLQAEVTSRLKLGERVRGYTLEGTLANTSWTIPDESLTILGEAYGVDMIEEKLLSPAKAKKAGLPKDVLAKYTTRKPGAPKLVRTDYAKDFE